MSISIPYFFQPRILNNINENKKSLIIDGGVLSNYPVWLFDANGTPRWPTIGFKLSGNQKIGDHKITNIINFTSSIIETMLETQDDIHIGEMDYLRTVKIDTVDVKTTEFNISNKKVIDLYNSGEICAIKFLEQWEDNYKKHKVLRSTSRARRFL
jgi:NTE family protein